MRISFRQGPPATELFMDYLDSWARVREFYGRPYSFDDIARFAKERPRPEASNWGKLCSILASQQKDWGSGERGVEKLAGGAVAVVTGQQPVLFTGPLFSILKAISVIKLAQRLEGAGIPAVPVFWVAAEDHDHEELESTWILDRNSELLRVAVDLSGEEPIPAGWNAFRPDVRDAVARCMESLPQSEFLPELAGILEDAYKPGVSPVAAFSRMMARLFSGTDLVLVNPLQEELRSIARPTIDMAIRRNSEIRAALMARNRSLSAAGYHEQVRVDETFTGLFGYQGRARRALRPGDLERTASFSPNVLLRPVVQDALFPTAAYIGGPAEIAYFAQAAAVYQVLERPMPPIVPRVSATVIEPRIARAAEKYGVRFEDVLRGKDFLKQKVVASMGESESFDRVRERVDEQLQSLRSLLGAVDGTLPGALDTARQKVQHQVDTLKSKYVNAAARRNELIGRHIESISNSLFPEKKLQERVITFASFFARYGPAVLDRLMNGLSLDTCDHQLVEL